MSEGEENYEIVCVWELENFDRNCVGVELWSPVFVLNALDNTQWKIGLCVDNYENNSSHFFNFRLKCVSDEVPTRKIDCELSIMDVNGSPLQKTMEKSCDFSTLSYYSLDSLKVVEDIFGLSESKFFPKDSLTVRCRMQNHSSQSGNNFPELHTSRIRIERSCFPWILENFCQLQPFQKSKIHLMQKDSSSPVISFEVFFDAYERFQVKVVQNSHYAAIDASFKISILDANQQMCKTEDFSFCNSCISLSLKRRELVNNKTLYLPMGILSFQVECFFTIKEKVEENVEQFSYQDLYAIRDTARNIIFVETIPSETPVKDNSMTGDDKCNSSSHRQFFQNMRELYEEGLFSDAELVVQDKTFPIHRSFLSARFPTFFKTLFMEKQGYCHIEGFSRDTMRETLLFAYSDRLEENMGIFNVVGLYLDAKHNSFDELERATYSFFKANLNFCNVCDLLFSSNVLLKDVELKSAVVDFIVSHADEIIGSAQWQCLQKKYVQFTVEIMNKLDEIKLQKNSH